MANSKVPVPKLNSIQAARALEERRGIVKRRMKFFRNQGCLDLSVDQFLFGEEVMGRLSPG